MCSTNASTRSQTTFDMAPYRAAMRDANRWVLRGIKVLSSIPIYALTDPVTSPIHAVQHHLSTLRARDLDRPLTGTNLCPFGDSKRTTHETLALASVGCWWDYVGAAHWKWTNYRKENRLVLFRIRNTGRNVQKSRRRELRLRLAPFCEFR